MDMLKDKGLYLSVLEVFSLQLIMNSLRLISIFWFLFIEPIHNAKQK